MSQNHVVENNSDEKIRTAVDKAVLTVENRMHDAILTAMDKMVIPRVETAVRSITGSTGHGPISDVQNSDRRDFIGNAGNTPLMSAFSRSDLNTNQNRYDETRSEEDFEDGDFPALRSSYTDGSPLITFPSWRFEATTRHPILSPLFLVRKKLLSARIDPRTLQLASRHLVHSPANLFLKPCIF